LLFIPPRCHWPDSSRQPCGPRARRQRIAVGSAGGLISHLFDLKNKVGKSELDELIRSVGVKQAPRGKEILNRLAGRSPPVRRAHGEVRVVRHEEAMTIRWPLWQG